MSDLLPRVLRCAFTKNPCGTDTWAIGHPCECDSCYAYLQIEQAERALARARQHVCTHCGYVTVPQDVQDTVDTLRTKLHEAQEALRGLYECNVWYGQVDSGDYARLQVAKKVLAAL